MVHLDQSKDTRHSHGIETCSQQYKTPHKLVLILFGMITGIGKWNIIEKSVDSVQAGTWCFKQLIIFHLQVHPPAARIRMNDTASRLPMKDYKLHKQAY